MSETEGTPQVETPTQPVQVGSRTGQVKAFNAKKGYGFISVHGETDMDVFVHQTNINPLRSTYRTLTRGEYVSFDISDDDKHQALNVRGVGGGTLRCDAVSQRRPNSDEGEAGESEGFTTVSHQRRNGGGRGRGNGRGRGRGRGNGGGRPRGPRAENADGDTPSQTTMADFLPADSEASSAGADAPVVSEESS